MEKKRYILDRKSLKEFIRLNDSSYLKTNFDNYSITELVILKTEIELKNKKKKAI